MSLDFTGTGAGLRFVGDPTGGLQVRDHGVDLSPLTKTKVDYQGAGVVVITDPLDPSRHIVTVIGGAASSGWTDDGAIVRPTTIADQFVVGALVPPGAEIFSVVGSQRITANLVIGGNLTVIGTTTTINSTVVDIADRVVHFNDSTGVVAVPALITGVSVHRGATVGPVTRDHAALLWASDSDVVDPSSGTGFWRFSSQTGGDDLTVGADLDAQARMLRVSRTAGIGIRFETDNSADIGAAGVTRPRTGYFGTSVVVAGTVTISTDTVLGSAALNLRSTAATLALEATGANAITFTTNATERARFHTNGFFGVGTAAPASALVHVVRPATAVATDAGVRLTDANLAAGRTTQLLDLVDDNSGAGHSIEVVRSAGSGAVLSMNHTGGTGTSVALTRSVSGTAFRASTPVAGGIAVRAQGLAAGDVVLDLGLTDGSTTARILGNGNFGIGTAPATKLHIVDNSGATALRLERTAATARIWDVFLSAAGSFTIHDAGASTNRFVISPAGVGPVSLRSGSTTAVVAEIRGEVGQTADLLQMLNLGGPLLAAFTAAGRLVPGADNTGEIGTDALRWSRVRATSGVFDNTTLTGGLTRSMTNGEGVVIDAFRAVQIVPGTFQVARTLATALSTTDLFGFAQASIGIAASGQCLYDGVTSAQFETGLVLNEGDRVYLSRTVAGALTNTVAAFLPGNVVAEVGILVDDSAYVGTLLSNSIASIFIQVKTPTVL